MTRFFDYTILPLCASGGSYMIYCIAQNSSYVLGLTAAFSLGVAFTVAIVELFPPKDKTPREPNSTEDHQS